MKLQKDNNAPGKPENLLIYAVVNMAYDSCRTPQDIHVKSLTLWTREKAQMQAH